MGDECQHLEDECQHLEDECQHLEDEFQHLEDECQSGVDIEDSRIQYPNLFSDLHILQQKNAIILLKDPRRIFYNSIAQQKCDEDICKIWQKSK